MKIAIPKERRAHEARVAASPETVKKLIALGAEVTVEKGAGETADFTDEAFKAVGAKIAAGYKATVSAAELVLKVQRPVIGGKGDEVAALKSDAVVAAICDPFRSGEDMQALAAHGVTLFAMDFMPRITRAQSMDVLSSQSNLAGYKAVLDAAAVYGKAFPMMMTAAGTITPAKVMVMGAGVAGLQAIATARRLGAIVSATDVRPAAKEQVESLGAKFVAVEDDEFRQAETAGGYAKEMSEAYKEKQAALIAETVPKQDIVITTALIPGRPAPRLINKAMVESMKHGSVIVDLAVDNGGNCELSEGGKVSITKNGVAIVAYHNVPGRLAADASALYARNLYNFVELLVDRESKELAIDWEDDIVRGTLIAKEGVVVHEALADLKAPAKAKPKPRARKPKAKAEPAPQPAADADAPAEKDAPAPKNDQGDA